MGAAPLLSERSRVSKDEPPPQPSPGVPREGEEGAPTTPHSATSVSMFATLRSTTRGSISTCELICETIRRRDRFRQSIGGILLIKQHLPLQIRQLDDITIDNPNESHPRPNQLLRDDATQSTASHKQHARSRKPILTGVANGAKQSLAVVSVHVHWIVADQIAVRTGRPFEKGIRTFSR